MELYKGINILNIKMDLKYDKLIFIRHMYALFEYLVINILYIIDCYINVIFEKQ